MFTRFGKIQDGDGTRRTDWRTPHDSIGRACAGVARQKSPGGGSAFQTVRPTSTTVYDRHYRNEVTMPPKIFVCDVRCLAVSPNECAPALYGRFRPVKPSCLLAQCDSSRLLRFRFAVRSHCRVIFFKFCSVVSVGFLYNFSVVICHLFSFTSNSVIICVCWP